jgi:hypothetical protein
VTWDSYSGAVTAGAAEDQQFPWPCGPSADRAPRWVPASGGYAPGEPKGTPWHPHRGFETVTYMIDGVFQHQDSNGGGGLITDGEMHVATAA